MAVEDECHCSDSSERSELTSSQTEDLSSMKNYPEKGVKNGATRVAEKDCLCGKVESENPENQLSMTRPVRQVSPQKFQPLDNHHEKGETTNVSCECPYAKVHNVKKRDDDKGSPGSHRPVKDMLNFKWPNSKEDKIDKKDKDKTYQVKVKKNLHHNFPKSYVCCEISEGIPKKNLKGNNDNNYEKFANIPITDTKEEPSEKIEIYYFDHGNSAYYRTTDAPPILATEKCAERTDYIATRFWAEIFGTVHIGMAFVTAFILQFVRFLLFSIVRPLTIGLVQLTADYLIKPSLSILFNGLIQPVLILFYNVATSFRDLCEPLAEGLGFFLREISQIFRAFRIVDVNNCRNKNSCVDN